MKTYNIEIKILTPIIIHTGSVYEPFELMSMDKKTISIINMNTLFSLMKQEEQEKFYELMKGLSGEEKNDIEIIKKARTIFLDILIREVSSPRSLIARKANVVSETLIDNLNENPRLEVHKIFRNTINGKAFIPGSSLKGVFRTAILEKYRKKINLIPNNLEKSNDFEMRIMKNNREGRFKVEDDPFRFIKISDLDIEESKSHFGEARVIGKNKNMKGIPIYTEISDSQFMSKKAITARGSMTIDEKNLERFMQNNNIKITITAEEIIDSLKKFYVPQIENNKHPISSEIVNLIKESLHNDSAPLKIGRFTQIESKTFKVEFSGRKNFEGGVSRTLLQPGNIPAGWAVCRIIPSNG